MADGDEAERLSPLLLRQAVRVACPFRREVGRSALSSTTSEKLQVVYDPTFDRFFLAEKPTPAEPAAPIKSPKPKRKKAEPLVAKKKAVAASVRWEDLILPPKSTAKRTADSVVYDYSGLIATDVKAAAVSGDSPTTVQTVGDTSDVKQEVPLVEPFQSSIEPGGTGGKLEQVAANDAASPPEHPTPESVGTVSPQESVFVLPSEVSAKSLTINPEQADEATIVLDSAVPPQHPGPAAPVSSSTPRTQTREAPTDVQSERPAQPVDPAINSAGPATAGGPTEVKSPEQIDSVATSPPSENVVEVANRENALALHLDLAKLQDNQPASVPRPRSSLGKSPKRRNRVANYERHFAEAAASVSSASLAASCLRVDNQEENQVRWQGDVVHVDVDVPVGEDEMTDSERQPHRNRQRQCYQPMSHIYSLKELMRIRPHADGFRHVNEGCTFTELTSSSSSSESEEEQIAVVQLASSSDDEDGAAFKRGDSVLFFARHRWFTGTILKRIKASWFYDIRAANGSVFEAVQAKRIRLFDRDDEPTYTFEVGDRVLWQPELGKPHAERLQSYRARVLVIRRPSTKINSRDRRHQAKRYDLELLTGRVVKKAPHAELRPLYRHRM